MGGTVQQLKASGVPTQLEVLPVWMYRRLLHCSLPIAEADALHVAQIDNPGKTAVLQREMMSGLLQFRMRNGQSRNCVLQ